MEQEPRFVTVKFISKDLDVKETTVTQWIRTHQLQAYRVGKTYRIKLEDYEKFLEERRIKKDE